MANMIRKPLSTERPVNCPRSGKVLDDRGEGNNILSTYEWYFVGGHALSSKSESGFRAPYIRCEVDET